MKFGFLNIFLLSAINLLWANSGDIEYPIEDKFANNIKAFSSNDNNILLTYNIDSQKKKGSYIELISENGERIKELELDEMINIHGMIEYENHFIILAKELVEKSDGSKIYTTEVNEYSIYSIEKESFKHKSLNLINYILGKDDSFYKIIKSGVKAFTTNNEIIVYKIVDQILYTLRLRGNNLSSFDIDLSQYMQCRDFEKVTFERLTNNDSEQVLSNFVKNKIYVTEEGALVFIYNVTEERQIEGISQYFQSINLFRVDLENEIYSNFEVPHDFADYDAVVFKDKLWIYGRKKKSTDFVLKILDVTSGKSLPSYLAAENVNYPDFVNGKAAAFRPESGKEAIENFGDVLKNLSYKRPILMQPAIPKIHVNFTQDEEYLVEIASLPLQQYFMWNRYSIHGNKDFAPFMRINAPNKEVKENALGYNEKVWATYLAIKLDTKFNVSNLDEPNKLSIEAELYEKKKLHDSIIEKYESAKMSSRCQLKHNNKTFIFYVLKEEKKKIFIHVTD